MSQLPGQAANRLHQTGCHRSGSAGEWQLWSRPDVDHSPNQLSAVHPNRSFNGTCVDEGHLPPRRGPASGCYARSELELPTHIGHAAAEIARPTAAIRSITATALPRKRGTTLTRLVWAATMAHRSNAQPGGGLVGGAWSALEWVVKGAVQISRGSHG
jgi:hypothetical protein